MKVLTIHKIEDTVVLMLGGVEIWRGTMSEWSFVLANVHIVKSAR